MNKPINRCLPYCNECFCAMGTLVEPVNLTEALSYNSNPILLWEIILIHVL